MKTILNLFLAASLFAISGLAQSQTRYAITDLGTLGGAYSYGYGVNNAGQVTAGSATPTQGGGVAQTAALWSSGQMINLGTLPGAACPTCNSEAAAASQNGAVAIISETASLDLNGEDFCGFGTHRQCRAAIWKNGVMSALPMLPGGQNSQAYWINKKGEAAGFSETGVTDGSCAVPYQVRRYSAAKWTGAGNIQALSPLSGDTVSFAFGINDNGQAAGVSGLCANTFIPPLGAPSGPHAVLWESDGRPVDLGTLPGGVAYAATGINNNGTVAGNALFADGTVHPIRWTAKDGMQDLGVPDGDFVAIAPCCGAINNRNDMVGFSCPGPLGTCRAILRTNNAWLDLNTLAAPGAPLYLVQAASINDSGQITGTGMTPTGEFHAFLATPIN